MENRRVSFGGIRRSTASNQQTFDARSAVSLGTDLPLTTDQVEELREKYGPNTIVTAKRVPWYMILLQAIFHPFNILLCLIAISSAVADEYSTAIVIAIMIVLSSTLRFYQEWKSEGAVHGLLKLITKSISVIRIDSVEPIPREMIVASEELVPGDLIVLRPGEVVPADGVVLSSKVFFVSQAPLTGEALPVEKYRITEAALEIHETTKDSRRKSVGERVLHAPISKTKRFFRLIFGLKVSTEAQLDAAGFELKEDLSSFNNVFMGSQVISGVATVRVIRTGHRTLFGKMAEVLSKSQTTNPFQQGVKRISWIFFLTMLLMIPPVLVLHGVSHNWHNAFIFSLAVAVGLTPEMLPMIVNANLAKGSVEMTKKYSIIKKLDAIINMGAVDVLCTDKTGTLTKSVVQLATHVNPYGDMSYVPLQLGFLNSYFQSILQNPLDSAITAYYDMIHDSSSYTDLGPDLAVRKSFLVSNAGKFVRRFSRLDEVPFDFTRRRLSVILHETGDQDSIYLVCKGAVDETLSVCTKVLSKDVRTDMSNERIFPHDTDIVALDEGLITELQARCNKYTELGERLLAVAFKRLPNDKVSATAEDEADLILVGFLSFVDPPKETTKDAVMDLRKHNVDIKVLTGDSPNICVYVCQEIDLPVQGVVTGADLISAEQNGTLGTLVNGGTIFAKLTPLQKSLVVQTLKNNGHVVGFLGDGINDAPALKEADVGISVENGVDICRESADIILLDKDLSVVVDGIRIGRKTYGNTIKYIAMAVSSNFGNVFSVLVASCFLPYEPMQSLQLLTQNLLYDFSQISIPWDSIDEEFMLVPHKWRMHSILRFMLWMGPWSSVFDIATFLFMYYYYDIQKSEEEDPEGVKLFQTTWFTVGLLTQTLIVHMIRTARIPIIQSRASWPVTICTIFIMCVGLAFPYIPFINEKMEFYPTLYTKPEVYYFLVGVLAAYCIAANVAKFIYVKLFKEWF